MRGCDDRRCWPVATSRQRAANGSAGANRRHADAAAPRRHRRPRRRRHLGSAVDHGLRQAARRRSRRANPVSAVDQGHVRLQQVERRWLTTRRGSACRPADPRMFGTPYPSEFIQDGDRIVVIFEGGAHVWREIHMDGRPLPKREELNPTYFGYSVGRWDGDVLVVETTGFNEKTWLNFNGAMHTDELLTVERISRPNRDTLHYEATITDPGAYTRALDDRLGHSVARRSRAGGVHLPREQPVPARPQGRLRQSVLRGRSDAEPLKPGSVRPWRALVVRRQCAAGTQRASRSPARTSKR